MHAAAKEEMPVWLGEVCADLPLAAPFADACDEVPFAAASVAVCGDVPFAVLLAANADLAKNSHQGVKTKNTALHQGITWSNSTTALGLRGVAALEGVRKNDSARYYNSTTGRFWTADSYEGNSRDPLSLHKYLYAEGNPVDHVDRSGHEIDEVMFAVAVAVVILALSVPANTPVVPPPTHQVLRQNIVRDPSVGHYKEFLLQITAPLAGIRFTVVQWLQGSYKINGRPAPGLQHQNQSIPFDIPDWQIDSFTNLAEYPGLPGATSLTKEQNSIELYDAPGAHGALAPGTYEADLQFQVNVYQGSISNDVSSFHSVNDPAPVLSIPWDFHDIYQVEQ
jgi:RHS repeat-associated protein